MASGGHTHTSAGSRHPPSEAPYCGPKAPPCLARSPPLCAAPPRQPLTRGLPLLLQASGVLLQPPWGIRNPQPPLMGGTGMPPMGGSVLDPGCLGGWAGGAGCPVDHTRPGSRKGLRTAMQPAAVACGGGAGAAATTPIDVVRLGAA